MENICHYCNIDPNQLVWWFRNHYLPLDHQSLWNITVSTSTDFSNLFSCRIKNIHIILSNFYRRGDDSNDCYPLYYIERGLECICLLPLLLALILCKKKDVTLWRVVPSDDKARQLHEVPWQPLLITLLTNQSLYNKGQRCLCYFWYLAFNSICYCLYREFVVALLSRASSKLPHNNQALTVDLQVILS